MSGRLTKTAYRQLCREDIAWLKQFPDCLERKHIIAIIQASIDLEYPIRRREIKQFCPNGHPMGEYDANCDYDCIGQ